MAEQFSIQMGSPCASKVLLFCVFAQPKSGRCRHALLRFPKGSIVSWQVIVISCTHLSWAWPLGPSLGNLSSTNVPKSHTVPTGWLPSQVRLSTRFPKHSISPLYFPLRNTMFWFDVAFSGVPGAELFTALGYQDCFWLFGLLDHGIPGAMKRGGSRRCTHWPLWSLSLSSPLWCTCRPLWIPTRPQGHTVSCDQYGGAMRLCIRCFDAQPVHTHRPSPQGESNGSFRVPAVVNSVDWRTHG